MNVQYIRQTHLLSIVLAGFVIVGVVFSEASAYAGCEEYSARGLQSHEELLREGWIYIGEKHQAKLYHRKVPDSSIHEVMARGEIDASPRLVFDVVTDYANYSKFMPYTEVSKIMRKEPDVIWIYERLNFPVIGDRHFIVKARLHPCPSESGIHIVEWSQDNTMKLPEEHNAIVPKVNDGRWELWPVSDGKRTIATYYLHTDPAGWIPSFLVNIANKNALPKVMINVRKRIISGEGND